MAATPKETAGLLRTFVEVYGGVGLVAVPVELITQQVLPLLLGEVGWLAKKLTLSSKGNFISLTSDEVNELATALEALGKEE